MKNWKLFFSLFWALPLLSFAHNPEQDTELRSLSPFTEVKASSGVNVKLTPGLHPEVRVSVGRRGRLSGVKTEVSGRTLRVSASNSMDLSQVEVEVFYQELTSLRASSSASILGEEFIVADKFLVDVSSSARVQAKVQADEVKLDCSSTAGIQLEIEADQIFAEGSSTAGLVLSGQAQRFVGVVSSGAEIKGYNLTVEQAILDVSSGGNIEISVTERLEAEASSGGSIRYKGQPSNTFLKPRSGGSIKSRN
ncbi:MAG: head GIN domain-containing protein [Bacteroidota bacterium]